MAPKNVKDEELSTIQKSVEPSSSRDGGAFVLVVLEGPDKGKTFRVDGAAPSRVLVGQSEACGVRLSDRQVSRRHAAIEQVGGRLRVTDLESTNGTFVDKVAIVDAFVAVEQSLRFGATVVRVDRETEASAPPLSKETRFGRFVGASREVRRVYPFCERLAASNVPVVLEGETGTGKEVMAEALHEAGPRASAPFVVFDCTAVPPSLAESELFGHERGAFTGAVAARRGVFEQAHGGTLFIDEIGDLDPALQPKLLRAIERSEVRRVGGDKMAKVDVRIVAATRRDLDREVAAGRFRDDLYHRICVTRLELPPLRRRRGDVTVLASHFWTQLGGDARALTPAMLAKWEAYTWPGNVRELRNAVARQLALGELAAVEPPKDERTDAAAPDLIARVLKEKLPLVQARQRVVDAFEERYIEQVLAEHGGNVARAAEASGIARRYFQLLRSRKR